MTISVPASTADAEPLRTDHESASRADDVVSFRVCQPCAPVEPVGGGSWSAPHARTSTSAPSLAAALITAAAQTRWPDGTRVLDAEDAAITRLANAQQHALHARPMHDSGRGAPAR